LLGELASFNQEAKFRVWFLNSDNKFHFGSRKDRFVKELPLCSELVRTDTETGHQCAVLCARWRVAKAVGTRESQWHTPVMFGN
jgi:hypothetical protein